MILNKASYLKISATLRDLYFKAIDSGNPDDIKMADEETVDNIEKHRLNIAKLKLLTRDQAVESIMVSYYACVRQSKEIFGDDEEISFDFKGIENYKADALLEVDKITKDVAAELDRLKDNFGSRIGN